MNLGYFLNYSGVAPTLSSPPKENSNTDLVPSVNIMSARMMGESNKLDVGVTQINSKISLRAGASRALLNSRAVPAAMSLREGWSWIP